MRKATKTLFYGMVLQEERMRVLVAGPWGHVWGGNMEINTQAITMYNNIQGQGQEQQHHSEKDIRRQGPRDQKWRTIIDHGKKLHGKR